MDKSAEWLLEKAYWPALGSASIIGLALYLLGFQGAATAVVIAQGASLLVRFALMIYLESKFTVDLLMSIAGIILAVEGMPLEGFILYILYSIAETMEFLIERLARKRLEDLVSLVPSRVLVQRGPASVEVPVSQVGPGDVIIVRKGEAVPVNGILLDKALLDTSMVTGEPLPVEMDRGSLVESGYINVSPGPIRVRASKRPEESTLQIIVRTALEYSEAKGRIARLIERAAPPYTFLVLAAGIVGYVALGPQALVSIVVAGCPSAFIVSNAASIMLSVAQLARVGVIVKGGMPLERGSRTLYVVLDKTGTLTLARPRLASVSPPRGLSEDLTLQLVAAAASVSTHPLSRAIISEARSRGINAPLPREVEEVPGKGLKARVDGYEVVLGSKSFISEATGSIIEDHCGGVATVYISINGEPGALCFADEIDPGSRRSVESLMRMGLRLVLASGDRPERVESVARSLGISEYYHSMKPEEKLELVRRLRERSGRPVVMVGDGINDVEALSAADVGVAVGDVEQVAGVADVVMRAGVRSLPPFFSIARSFIRGVILGFAVAMAIKVGVAALGSLGIIPLWLVVLLGDDGSTIAATIISGATILLASRRHRAGEV